MPLNLTAQEEALDTVILPGGREADAQPFTFLALELYEALGREFRLDTLRALLQECVPTLTDAEFGGLTERTALLIVAHCNRTLQQTLEALKNGPAGAGSPPARPPRPSRPRTGPRPASPATPAPSIKTGGTSATASRPIAS